MCSGGIQLLSQFHPRLFTIASGTSSYGPSLVFPSDLIRSLCITRTQQMLVLVLPTGGGKHIEDRRAVMG